MGARNIQAKPRISHHNRKQKCSQILLESHEKMKELTWRSRFAGHRWDNLSIKKDWYKQNMYESELIMILKEWNIWLSLGNVRSLTCYSEKFEIISLDSFFFFPPKKKKKRKRGLLCCWGWSACSSIVIAYCSLSTSWAQAVFPPQPPK